MLIRKYISLQHHDNYILVLFPLLIILFLGFFKSYLKGGKNQKKFLQGNDLYEYNSITTILPHKPGLKLRTLFSLNKFDTDPRKPS